MIFQKIGKLTASRLLGFFVIFIVLMNFTFTYTFLSGLAGIAFKYVGIAMLAVLSFYLMVHFQQVRSCLRIPTTKWYLALFVCIPVLSAAYAPLLIPRFIGYYFLCGLLFLATLVWIQFEGWRNFAKLILCCWIVTVIGVLLSYFFPGMFYEAAQLREEATMSGSVWGEVTIATKDLGRAFGFYMQPNRASLVILFQVIIVSTTILNERPVWRYVLYAVTFGIILLTGSRAGFLLFVLTFGLNIFWEVLFGVRRKGRRTSFIVLGPYYFAFLLLAVVSFVAVQGLNNPGADNSSAVERIVDMFQGFDIRYDASVLARYYAQNAYIQGILQSPIWGHGLGSASYDRIVRGWMTHASHNNFLENAYMIGIPITIAMYSVLFYIPFSKPSKAFRRWHLYDLSWTLLLLLLVASLGFSSIFDHRIFPVIYAFWISVIFRYENQ